ncbi:MAG TPA: prolyl oligopeptidase family serine peptidase [Vicinamibacterales bacterium]
MHRRPSSRAAALLVALAFVASAPFSGALSTVEAQQPAAAKRPLTYDTYDYWRAIEGTELSRDGVWLAYALTSEAEDGELVVRNLNTKQEFRHPRGTNPSFTPDGRFVVFTVQAPKAEIEKARRAGARGGRAAGEGDDENQPRNGAGIMALPAGTVTTVDRIGTIRMPEESSAWVALHRPRAGGAAGRGGRQGRAGGAGRGGQQEPPAAAPPAAQEPAGEGAREGQPREKRKDNGTDLIVRNLASGEEVTIPLVSGFAWSRDGAYLAYGVSSPKAEEDGAFVRRMSNGAVTTLHAGKGNYKGFAFDEAGKQLAFLSDQAEYEKPVSPYRLYYWKPGDAAAAELVSAATAGMPEGMVVSDQSAPRFTEDGRRLTLGTAPPPKPPAEPGAPAPIAVDLWHWKDPDLQPMQQVRANQDRNRTYTAVVHLANRRFVQLATPDLPNVVVPARASDRVMGMSDVPYRQEVSWDTTYQDVYLVDLNNGKRERVLEHWAGNAAGSLSPGGKYILYFDRDDGNWYSHRIADGARVNLTAKLPVKFFNETHDSPSLPGAYGVAGWTADDGSVLLNDRFDIWEIKPDGSSARMVTAGEGRKQGLVFRYQRLDPEERVIPANTPLLLDTTDDRTKASGFYRVALSGMAAPAKVVMLDKAFGNPTKARNADRVVFTLSRFEEFPDLWVSDTSFANMEKISNANPQQAEYVWGKAELIDYINADGKSLRAVMIKPDNFDPSKKYPLMVYIYEQLANSLHSYRRPNPGHSINITRYVSNGYVVLLPDIVYDTGYPGEAAEKCVIPAVNTVVEMDFVDPARIGIQGHSWGGYQITHLITRTNIFRAVQGGASVANMISAYGGIRWGTGMSRAFQYERTQSRIGAPPWDAPLQFIENSPIFWVEKVQTPYLTMHNDADDAVPWYQAIEFFSALRRLGKEAYFFNYNGERHGLRNRDNQKHYTVHLDEYFDHFLKGAPKPEWMEKGVPYLERGTRDVSGMFKRKGTTETTQQAAGR